MKARIEWKDGMSFLGESGSGHQVLMDGPPETGGRNLGPRPMEMLLMGTGGCAAFDVMLILKKGRQEISDCVVEIEAQRATNEPKVFTHIHFHFILTGKNLQPQQIERAISLSAEKYCSASIMLGKTAEMTHDFEIVEGQKLQHKELN
ncbi:peroxiredoxin [Nitrosomonadaceae bacterium]|jgi:putative redox protein|nr:OsmC family protein [Nitrosospira sp.]MBI0412882.1 OsmC family protein [Nitrosospira sp.]MSQ44610.1 OsmC family protein [Nitrosomonadaceae bacterium]GDX59306.1 peroxiredoxin [Nitrosomonadaceae bacterium]